MPRAFAPNSVLVVSVLCTDNVPGAWPAVRPERVVLVGQIVLELLVRRELVRRQNLLIPETAQGVVLERLSLGWRRLRSLRLAELAAVGEPIGLLALCCRLLVQISISLLAGHQGNRCLRIVNAPDCFGHELVGFQRCLKTLPPHWLNLPWFL